MDAVLGELMESGGACFTCGDHLPANEVDPALWAHIVPMQGGGAYVHGTGVGKTEHYLRNIGLAQRAGRVNRRLDGTTRLEEIRAVLDALDEQEAAGSALVLHLAPQPDIVGPNLLIQCKSCHDRLATPADLPTCDPLVSSAATIGAGPGTSWQVLPYYACRPFAIRSCCAARVVISEAVIAAVQIWRMPPLNGVDRTSLLHEFFMQLCAAAVVPLTVTIQDKQLAQDYREGLRQLLGSMLDTLRNIAVMVLAALSHLAQAPPFQLVLIATTRHYGLRGDSDGHFLPAPALQGIPGWGAVCLAA